MCRYFVMFKNMVNFSNWAALSTVGLKRECKDNTLSLGILQLDKNKNMARQKYIPPLHCFKEPIQIDPSADITFYHLRSTKHMKNNTHLSNIHPFVFDDRFIGMHNGWIHFKKGYDYFILPRYRQQIMGDTDSEVFFALWLSFYDSIQDIATAFQQAKTYTTPSSSMNLILYDKLKNELYVYRNDKINKFTPPVYITPEGFTNFKVPNSTTIPKGKLIVATIP